MHVQPTNKKSRQYFLRILSAICLVTCGREAFSQALDDPAIGKYRYESYVSSVSGVISDKAGKPVPNAHVAVVGLQFDGAPNPKFPWITLAETKTGSDGKYIIKFHPLVYAWHDLFVISKNCGAELRRFELNAWASHPPSTSP